MRIFDIFRRKKSSTDSNSDLAEFRVPENASLELYGEPPPVPAVNRTKGGALIASMGVTSDQPLAELEAMLREVEDALGDGQPDFVTSEAQMLSDAFLDTSKTNKARAIVWVLNPKVFAMWSEGAKLLQRLICRWVNDREAGLGSILCVQDPEIASGTLLVSILGELGFTTRGPDVDGSFLAAVHRADDITVVCLLGSAFQPEGGQAEWFEEWCQRRFRAECDGNEAMRQELDKALRDYLDAQFSSLRAGESKVPDYAPYLRGLMWDAATGDKIANKALLKCLVEREANLAFPVDASAGSAPLSEWPNHGHGLEVFPDLFMVRELLCDNDPDRIEEIGDLPSADVLKWMADENAGLGIRIGDPEEPSRVLFLDAETVASALGDYKPS